MPNNMSIVSGLGLVKTAGIKLTPKTTRAAFKLLRRLSEPIAKTVDKRVRIPFRKREMDLVAKRIDKLNAAAEIAAKNYDDAVIAFGKVPRLHGQIQLSREGINAAKADIAAKKAARDAAMIDAHVATNENVTAAGIPKATVKEKLFSALGLVQDSAKSVTDFVKDHPDAAELTGTALGIPLVGAAGYAAGSLVGSDESTDTKKSDNEEGAKQGKDDTQAAGRKHSVLGYGIGGALTAAAAAYIASARKNRLRNMLVAGVLGGAGGSGLAYWLNSDRA